MDKKKHFILLNHLVNKNRKLFFKLISEQELYKLLEIREMRKSLKYCNQKHSFMMEVILNRDVASIKKHLRLSIQAFDKLVELGLVKHHGYDAKIEIGVTLF